MKKRLNLNRTKLFEPSVVRDNHLVSDFDSNNLQFKSNDDLLYESKKGKTQKANSSPNSKFGKLFSTNELNIDYSKFENHTFFDSAVSKTNISFDRVINNFPFDASKEKINNFRENSTGFETYVFDSFPVNKGYLIFQNDASHHLSVKDQQGYLYATDSEKNTGDTVFSPEKKGFTTEFWVNLPPVANDRQTICQLIDTNRAGISLSLVNNTSVSNCEIIFTLNSGSRTETIAATISKGAFQHVAAVYDNTKKVTKLYLNSKLAVSSSVTDFNMLETRLSDFLIGSGSIYTKTETGTVQFDQQNTFTGSLDEFRYYHGAKTQRQIKESLYSPIFNGYEENLDLKLYFRFNEPTGNYSGNNLAIDYSGNNLHTEVENYTDSMRLTGSFESSPMTNENPKISPVLFADHSDVMTLNRNLLISASLYDEFNPNIITNLVPVHYLLQGQLSEGFNNVTGSIGSDYKGGRLPDTGQLGDSQLLVSFLMIWAKFYDELKLYIDNFSNILNVSYDKGQGSSAAFYQLIAEQRGIRLPSLFDKNIDNQKFFEGINLDNKNSFSKLSLSKIQNEVWKRLLINMKHIHKEKGTKRSIISLFNSFGLEFSKYFDFKEYGGPKSHYLSDLRKFDTKKIKYIDFSGSINDVFRPAAVDSQGFHRHKQRPFLRSLFLSGTRVEVGFPHINESTFATSTVTVGTTDPSHLDGKILALTNSLGTIKTYLFDDDNALGATGTSTANGTIIQINGKSAVATIAAEIEKAVENSNGHAGTIDGSRASGVVTFRQKIGLSGDGNTPVFTNVSNADHLSVSNFSGGLGFKSNNSYDDLPHGIFSVNRNDGLFTSGSFTYEGVYKFEKSLKHSVTQSLIRLGVTGSTTPSSKTGIIANVIAIEDGKNTKLKFYTRPHNNDDTDYLESHIVSASIFDGDPWYVSFGRVRSDDNIFYKPEEIIPSPSSSYFLRCGKIGTGEANIYFATSSMYNDSPDNTDSLFNTALDTYNSSGPFLLIGSQSITTTSQKRLLNAADIKEEVRSSNFSGKVSSIRFWSSATSEKESRERIRNIFSLGVENPKVNFNHTTKMTGSFSRLRMNVDISRQITSASDANGDINLFDTSKNNLHIDGRNFEASKLLLKSDMLRFSRLSVDFDERVSEDKVRVRGYSLKNNFENSVYSREAPVYEISEDNKADDDKRVSIDLNAVKALNEDIVKMFESLDVFDEYIGDPRNMFEDSYIELENVRKIYFNELVDKIDLSAHSKFFTWFDNSFTSLITSLIPLETVFLGVNYVIEPHILERNRIRYHFNDQYLLGVNTPPPNNDFQN